MKSEAITLLSSAERAVAKAKTVQELKTLRDKAEAVRIYAHQAKLGLEIENHAAEVRLRAERRAGELLAGMEKAKGELLRGNEMLPRGNGSKLQDLGVTKAQSSRWQAEAAVPEKDFENWIEKSNNAKELSRDVRQEQKAGLELPWKRDRRNPFSRLNQI